MQVRIIRCFRLGRRAAAFLTVALGFVIADVLHASLTRSDTSSRAGVNSEETFVPDCELYMFGRLVPPVTRDGRSGLVVKREDNVITINGRLYMEVEPIRPAEPETTAHATTLASNAVRRSKIEARSANSLTVDGQPVRIGEFVPFAVEGGDSALVAYYETFFEVKYRTYTYRFKYVEPARAPVDTSAAEVRSRAGRIYTSLVRGLRPGAIILLGTGYQTTYRDPSVFPDLRTALSQIPARARRLSHAGYVSYESLQVGQFFFLGSEVRDFVEASEENE